MNLQVIASLRKKFPVHPLIFERSFERATSQGELFDILDSFPKQFPVVWCDAEKRWKHTTDLFQSANYK